MGDMRWERVMQPSLASSNMTHLRQTWQQALTIVKEEEGLWEPWGAEISGLWSGDTTLALLLSRQPAVATVSAISWFKDHLS